MEAQDGEYDVDRYFRSRQVALRFLEHGARTAIVSEWSGLTVHQLKTQRPRWGFGPEDRQSGPARSSFKKFFEPAKRAEEFSLLAGIQRIVGLRVARRESGETALLRSLENGERVLEAFEVFREWEPASSITFEESLRLAEGVVAKDEIELEHCAGCDAARLVYKLGTVEHACLRCKRRAGQVGRQGKRRKRTPS